MLSLKALGITLVLSRVSGMDVEVWGNEGCHGNNWCDITACISRESLLTYSQLAKHPISYIKTLGQCTTCSKFSTMLTSLPSSVIRNLYVLPMEKCFHRGEFVVDQKTDGIGGNQEKAIATMVKDTASVSQYVVFFSDDDCDPDSAIDNAWLEDGFSSLLPNNPKEYKSWNVWDLCLEELGCSLD
jgi:hypothetical protein